MNITNKEHYLNIFNVTAGQMENVIAAALRRGGDYADLYFEYTTYNDLLLKDGEVTSGGFHIDFGVGIRVLDGEKTGYAYSESTGIAEMTEAAMAASAIASGTCPKQNSRYAGTAVNGPQPDFYPIVRNWRDTAPGEFLPFLKSVEAAVRAKESRVEKVVAKLSSSQSDIMMFNSIGELVCDSRPLCSLTLSVVFTDGRGRSENSSVSRSFRMGAEFVSPVLAEELAAEAVRNVDAKFEAIRPKGGPMPVVMGFGASGILLHEAMGHSFEADFNRKGQSIFSGRIGEKVCAENISIVDDGTILNGRGSGNYDDEGIPGQKTYMVRDGVLTSYLHDRISAAYFGVAPTGNGRRESFRYNPIPRMRSTYMEGGDTDSSDIIAQVQKGIYVDEFANGQVKIGEGDFTFYVKSGYMIENGRLTAPIKDLNVIGNGPQALADIIAVGNDLKIDNGTWTCGKEQSVPVTCGIPTVLVRNLIVGGE